jgi:hypothetical protein
MTPTSVDTGDLSTTIDKHRRPIRNRTGRRREEKEGISRS